MNKLNKNQRIHRVVKDDGEVIEVGSLALFARKFGFNRSMMSLLVNGRIQKYRGMQLEVEIEPEVKVDNSEKERKLFNLAMGLL